MRFGLGGVRGAGSLLFGVLIAVACGGSVSGEEGTGGAAGGGGFGAGGSGGFGGTAPVGGFGGTVITGGTGGKDAGKDAKTGGTGGYVDPGCPDSAPPPPIKECDPFGPNTCPTGEGCYPFVQYPTKPCDHEVFGAVCAPVGTGKQGDACGATNCAAGFVCVVTGQGTECVQLCDLFGAAKCPPGTSRPRRCRAAGTLYFRRALVALGLAVVCAPVATVSCGSKSGLRIEDRDAATDANVDALPDGPMPACISDDDCVTEDLCHRRTCQEGKCSAPVELECDDEDPCTEDTCVPELGACDFRELALDQDGDGFKGPRPGFAPGAPGSCGDDCDDTSAKAYPGGTEVCDGVDNNCNGVVDEGMSYVPVGKGDVRVSGLDQMQAGHGGIAWSGELYAAAYAGQKSAWRTYVKGLASDGSTKLGDSPITNVPSDTFTGPIVWTGNIFGTAWEDRRDNDYEIYFNRIDAGGKKLGPDLRVTNADGFSLHASMIWNGAEFVLVWDDRRNGQNDYRVYGQRIDVDGKMLGGNVELTGPNIRAESPRIAEGEKTLGMVFNMVTPISKKVGFRTLAPDLTTPSSVVTISDDSAVDASIVWNKDRYVVAYSKRPNIPGDAIWGATVKEDGTLLVKEKKLTSGAKFARTQSLLPLGDRLLLLWADDHDGNYELYSQMLNNELEVISPRKRVTNDPSDTVAPVAVFGPEGDVGVLFDDRRTGAWQVYFTRLSCVAGN
jgi:hypothetical protein